MRHIILNGTLARLKYWALYDLSGRPVPAAATLSRGIYIKNNRKQVVK